MAIILDNPFITKGYCGKEYFCDRESEVQDLVRKIENNVDISLISERRLGKTGLIFRVFEELECRKIPVIPVYADIYATENLADFVKILSESVLSAYPEKTTLGKKFIKFLRGLRPVISFDHISGDTQVSIAYQNESEKEQTLKDILLFLEGQPERVVVAIDEFQQIREYPEKNVEALLRTIIQRLGNTGFIFSGSKKHIMADIFASAKNPFYSSTSFFGLDKIPAKSYSEFISSMFKKYKRSISEDAVEFILDWTERHTFYTQALCRSVFSSGVRSVELPTVRAACLGILEQNESIYLQYRAMLTPGQWSYLIAVGKEDGVSKLQSKDFLAKYGLGSASSSKRTADALLDKELLVARPTLHEVSYHLSDLFMKQWIRWRY